METTKIKSKPDYREQVYSTQLNSGWCRASPSPDDPVCPFSPHTSNHRSTTPPSVISKSNLFLKRINVIVKNFISPIFLVSQGWFKGIISLDLTWLVGLFVFETGCCSYLSLRSAGSTDGHRHTQFPLISTACMHKNWMTRDWGHRSGGRVLVQQARGAWVPSIGSTEAGGTHQ